MSEKYNLFFLASSLDRQTTFVVFVLLVFSGSSIVGNAAENEKPNVVLLCIDDLGYGDLGVYGCADIPTPNIDQLAREGVRCTASYITNPPCCPSRCSLMMGQYGQRFGKYGMSRGLPIPEDRPTLAEFLRDRGYVTGQIGKWDIGTKRQGPLQSGFMEVAKNPPRKQYTEEELVVASKELQKQLADKHGKSKYFCVNEAGETVWLTDYNGDSMVDFTAVPAGGRCNCRHERISRNDRSVSHRRILVWESSMSPGQGRSGRLSPSRLFISIPFRSGPAAMEL